MNKLILSTLVVLFSCNSLDDRLIVYTIKEGKHFSHIPRVSPVKDLHFKAKFGFWIQADSSIQKLYGIADGFVHRNSARFGWRCSNYPFIDIFAYWYYDGKLNTQWMGRTKSWQFDDYEILLGDSYYFRFNNNIFITDRVKDSNIGQRLFPYYEDSSGRGAPEDLKIYVYEY